MCVLSKITPGAVGQKHHPISRVIEDIASNNPNLKGYVSRNGWGTIQAGTRMDHIGYQKWHRNFDRGVTTWLKNHPNASVDDFVEFMNKLYGSSVASSKFGYVSFS